MAETQGAAPEAKPQSETTAAPAQGKRDDLDSLVGEFSRTAAADKSPLKSGEVTIRTPDGKTVTTTLDDLRKGISQDVQTNAEAKAAFEKDISAAIKTVKEHDVLGGLSDKVVNAWLQDRIANDGNLLKAFQLRGQNRPAWNKIIGVLRDELAGEVTIKPQGKDREAVRAAAQTRNVTSKGKEPDWLKASDQELNAAIKALPPFRRRLAG